tara:strand:- start:13505 stop:13807 length:303 start_codon:yes stop_codon:yes gene_type:complete
MRYINVNDEFVSQILTANRLVEDTGVSESEVVEEAQAEEHVCPLCESELDEAISEESMKECIDFILGTLNEALEQDGESLEEAEDADEDEEDYEEDEDEA